MKRLSAACAVLLCLALGAAHGQPREPGDALPKKSKPAKPSQPKGGASAGRSAPPPFVPDPAYDASYRQADMDGDGEVSKAEAAGNEPLVLGFFRADRNRDGKLDRKEYEALFHAKEKADARARERAEKAQARAAAKAGQASVGSGRAASR